jgi:hypothetical protein
MAKTENIKKMLNYPPSESILSLFEFKKEHKRKCLSDYSGYVKLIEEAIETLILVTGTLNYLPKETWPKHRGIQYGFLPGSIETLFCSFDDLMDGFYEEGTILNRSVFDSIFKIAFITFYPDKVGLVLGIKPPKGTGRYNVSKFIKEELKIDWSFLWHYSSSLVHGKSHRVVKMWCDSSKGIPQILTFDLKYDKTNVTRPMNEILVYSWCLLRLVLLFTPEVLTNENIPLATRDKLSNIELSLRESLLGMPNKLKNVVSDFEKVEKMLCAAETGKDWKILT